MTGRSLFRPPGPDPEPSVPALRRWPGLIVWGAAQIVLFLLLFQAYKVVRKTFITRAERVAFDNAEQILSIQGALNSNFELDLQRWVLDRGDLILVFNRFYAHYMVGFYLVAMVLLVLAPDRYRYLRRVFILSMIIALPWYAIYPLAPPRFMEPYGWPFVDTLRVYGPNYFSETGLVSANRYAAMPSMHCGWTMVGGWMIAAALPWRHVGRILSVFVIVFMGLTVIVTGNHYWLDIVGGWAVAFAALLVNCWLPYPLPIRWPWQRAAAAGADRHPVPSR